MGPAQKNQSTSDRLQAHLSLISKGSRQSAATLKMVYTAIDRKMLVVNNGVPKSGSTLIQKALILTGKFEMTIGEWQNPKWKNMSVSHDHLGGFLHSNMWHDPRNICIKMHCSHCLVQHPGHSHSIKVITSFRNLKDSIVSMAYHNLRVQSAKNRTRDYWIKDYFSDPCRYGNTAKRLGLHYLDALRNGAYMVNYQDMTDRKSKTFADMYSYLGISVSEEELSEICAKTDPGIRSKEDISEGSHVRTGGISVAQDELPAFTLQQLDALYSILVGSIKSEEEYSELCEKVIQGQPL
ncbi:MAG: hypothetical protein EA413_08585 [Cyanobium sp. PLM2.Bin73]|nr:MAG: hypothetical protein EA413_08585 [Cyanobium sp. PLM2.Bin73]